LVAIDNHLYYVHFSVGLFLDLGLGKEGFIRAREIIQDLCNSSDAQALVFHDFLKVYLVVCNFAKFKGKEVGHVAPNIFTGEWDEVSGNHS
jgi:hypothetical protein